MSPPRPYGIDLPYAPAFQPPYPYAIALPRRPEAGETPWPGRIPPVAKAPVKDKADKPVKEVRFALPPRSPHASSPPKPTIYRKHNLSRLTARVEPDAPESPPRPARPAAAASLNSLLAYTSRGAAILFDLTQHPSWIRLASSHPTQISARHREQPATHPPLAHLRISCARMPWPIDVDAPHGRALTVGDVLDALWDATQHRVRGAEYAALDARASNAVNRAFHDRSARMGSHARTEHAQGVRRVDWLAGYTTFCGLAPTREPNTWALILTTPR